MMCVSAEFKDFLDTKLNCNFRRRTNRVAYSRFSSEGALSEEENTSERSRQNTPDHMLSSLSTENLQLELTAHCGSDGLSDKESIVQRMKQVVKHSPERALSVRTDLQYIFLVLFIFLSYKS